MYTYVQRPGCKKENTATYVHTGRVSNAYSCIRTWLGRNGETTSSSCSWGANRLGRNGMRGRVHREGLDGTGDGNEAWRTAERRKRTSYGRNWGPVDRDGCGVPQNGRNGPPTIETGVMFIGRGVAYRKTGLHEILFISTVDLLQPPRATVDLLQPPWAPVHPASTTRYSTGYCSTTPPRAPLHHLLFIQPSTTPWGPVHPEAMPLLTVHPTPRNAHCSSNRSASVSSSS